MGFYSSKFGYKYNFPRNGVQIAGDASTISVKNTDSVSPTVGGKDVYDISFTDTSIYFQFAQPVMWASSYHGTSGSPARVLVNGPVFSDTANKLSDIVSVQMKTNIAGLTSSDLKFDANKISLDFTGIFADTTSYVWLIVRFNDPIKGTNRADVLSGNKWDNVITGLKGDDVLIGAGGADKLDGGEGNDTASYAGSKGVTASLANPAVNTGDAKGDTYISIENLTGSSLRDTLIGDSGANKISGGGGNDTLYGGLGADILTGGTGKDRFVFDTTPSASNVDTIVDFNVKEDKIWLDSKIFSAVASGSTVSSSMFYIGSAAHDANDQIIYDSTNGKLYYDEDGSGAAAAVQFAELQPGLSLTATNFVLFA